MSEAIWIGGPDNGKVIRVPSDHDIIRMPDREAYRSFTYLREPCSNEMFPTLTCRIFDLRLAPGRAIRGINHPEITEETARMYLADLVIGAWKAKLADTRNRF